MRTPLLIFLSLVFISSSLSAQNSSHVYRWVDDLVTTYQDAETHLGNGKRGVRPVTLYSKANFSGERFVLNKDWSARRKRNDWNDQIASIDVPRGWEVWLYEHAGFKGRVLVVSRDWSVHDNPWWKDRISSVRLVEAYNHEYPRRDRANNHRQGRRRTKGITIYDNKDCYGPSMTIKENWSVQHSDDYWNDRISAINIPSGYEVVVYEHSNFRGRSKTLTGPWPIRRHRDFWDDWNNRISSIEILRR